MEFKDVTILKQSVSSFMKIVSNEFQNLNIEEFGTRCCRYFNLHSLILLYIFLVFRTKNTAFHNAFATFFKQIRKACVVKHRRLKNIDYQNYFLTSKILDRAPIMATDSRYTKVVQWSLLTQVKTITGKLLYFGKVQKMCVWRGLVKCTKIWETRFPGICA